MELTAMSVSPRWRLWVIASAAGIVLGGVSLIPYFGTAGVTHYLGNSAAIWLAAAFAVGTVAGTRWRAAIAGVLTLLITLEAFAVGTQILYGTPQNGWVPVVRILGLWAIPAVAGGSIYGVLGWFWGTGTPARRGLAAAAAGAAFLAEAGYTLLRSYPGADGTAALAAALGAAAILALARGRRARLAAISWLPVFLLAGLAGLAVAFGLVAAIARA
jgi:Family of unknown function (DUF6518)